MNTTTLATLAVSLGDGLPTAFRIFRAGWNATEHGRFLFDEQAASTVMAHYRAHEADRMIDLEHLSLDDQCANYDPDARGWARLELRGGELWAVDVKWTADGETRLRSKRQRYVSPAFAFSPDRRIKRIVNIAITALPATHGAMPLVAASAQRGRKPIMGNAHKLNETTPDTATQRKEIAKILNVADPNDAEAMWAAFETVMAIDLEARELAMCRERGVDVRKYQAIRAQLKQRIVY